ncbi:carboxypeptidase-like regulatory domain-containing protein [Blastopirellula marina]|nr:carboxypeptidase-like regulatory domain-containing protein [Blastopirellula marina]
MTSSILKPFSLSLMVLATLAVAGCGQQSYGDLGLVTGTVTMDGQPVKEAMVTFTPSDGGRPSRGVTDESGKYELIYIRTTKGAVPGEHRVMIETIAPDQGDSYRGPAFKDPIPAKYNKKSQLTETVELGPNTLDFNLEKK